MLPSEMNTSVVGLKLIRDSEGCVLTAYPDPASGAEPWTVGYGHTGPDVTPGTVITQDQAEAFLLADVGACEEAVQTIDVPLTQGMFDALVDFVFNLGAGQLHGSTLRRLIESKAYEAAADEFHKWANPPLPGIVKRRAAEHSLFLSQGVTPDA